MSGKLKRKWIMINVVIRTLVLNQHGTKVAEYLRKQNFFSEFGNNCGWHCKRIPSEPELISIGNNVHIAADVRFITHDIICDMFNRHPEYSVDAPWPFYKGRIVIKDNCMIGADSIIMYDTTIGPNAIVAAGSCVTKDIPSGEIWGGFRHAA